MSTNGAVALPDSSERFLSLAALRSAHNALMERRRAAGDSPELLDEIAAFIRAGSATGALLDSDEDRRAGQSLLDYWDNLLYRADYAAPDATLADFDPELAPELDDSLCPYLGLDAFREGDSERFFGRQRLVDELIARLETSRLLAIVGPSGSGKSSLVRAGLVPALRRGALDGSGSWRFYPPVLPGNAPIGALARAIQPPAADSKWLQAEVERLRESPGRLAELIAEAGESPAVLIIDQFEELFTLTTSEETRSAVLASLVQLITRPGPRHSLVLTMRSDFETFVSRSPGFQALFEQGRVQVTPLSAAELRDAIERPAAQVGLKFQEGVVDALLHDILGEPAALPLLQFTLLKLWEHREHDRVTWDAYRRLGGGRLALARSADEFFDGLIPEEQVTAKRILLRMVRPGDGLEVTSSRVRVVTLYQIGEARDRLDRVLEKLVASRLVRLTEGETPAYTQVEVAHEALVRNWPTLVGWLEDERSALMSRRRLEAQAAEWVRLGRGSSGLLEEVQLREAERWLSSPEAAYLGYDEVLPAFVKASRENLAEIERQEEAARARELAQARALAEEQQARAEAERQRAEAERQRALAERRGRLALRWLAILLTIVSLLAIWMAVNAFDSAELARTQSQIAVQAQQTAEVAAATAGLAAATEAERAAEAQVARETAVAAQGRAEQQARQALSGQIAAQAQASIDDYPQVSLLLAVEALRVTRRVGERSAVAEDVLRQALGRVGGVGLGGHAQQVSGVAISPGGRWLASASDDRSVRLWDLSAADPRAASTPLMGHQAALRFVAFGGRWLFSADGEGVVRLWDVESGAPAASPRVLPAHPGGVNSIAASPDGRWLATGGEDRRVLLWDLSAAEPQPLLLGEHADPVSAVAVGADGRWVLSGSRGSDTASNVTLWDSRRPGPSRLASRLRNHSRPVTTAAISPDGRWLATGSEDRKLVLWGLGEAGPANPVNLFGHEGTVSALAFSPDGRRLVSGSQDGSARVWDLPGAAVVGAQARVLRGHEAPLTALAFSPDGARLATAGEDGLVDLWELNAEGSLRPLMMRGHEGPVYAVAFSPDGATLVSGGFDSSPRLWDLRAPAEARPELRGGLIADEPRLLAEFAQPATTLGFSANAQRLLAAGADGALRAWDLVGDREAGVLIAAVPDAKGGISAISPDGRLLAFCSPEAQLRLIDINTGSIVREMPEPQGTLTALAFSPDGRYLAATGGRLILLWDLSAPADPPLRLEAQRAAVTSIAFSADGRWLASAADDRTARLWDLNVRPIVAQELSGHGHRITSIAFSPDSRWVATASPDGSLRLWNLSSADLSGAVRELSGHSAALLALAFSPDSRYLASGDEDGGLRLWKLGVLDEPPLVLQGAAPLRALAFSSDNHWLAGAGGPTLNMWDLSLFATGLDPIPLAIPQADIVALAFSPDSRWLAAVGPDAYLWDIKGGNLPVLIELACRSAGRNLSPAEWRQYFGHAPYLRTCENAP